jgi:hypothetical protein
MREHVAQNLRPRPRRHLPTPVGPRRAIRERGQSVVEFALIAPIMVLLVFAIIDLSRIYTTMMSVESAAREAADFGTSLGAERWSATNTGATVDEMRRRACVAASDLPDFAWSDADSDGVVDPGEDCTNPTFEYCIATSTGGGCSVLDPTAFGYDCDLPDRDPPCTITVTMGHVFHLFAPMQIDFFGVTLGLPVTLSFERDSTFAMTDIEVAGP